MARSCVIAASLLLSVGFADLSPGIAAELPAVPNIPSSVISSPTQITSDQRQAISQYIQTLVGQIKSLQGDQESQLPRLRQLLVEPLRQPAVSSFFLTAYGNELAGQLAQAMKSDSELIRVNGVILAQRSQHLATDLMIAALADECPAVRYWAAKSIGQMQPNNLPQAIESQLIQALAKASQGEETLPVLQRMLGAFNELNTPACRQQLLATLAQRLSATPADQTTAPLTELAALQEMFRKTAGLEQVDLDRVKSIAQVMYQYLQAAIPAYRKTIAQAEKAGDKTAGESLRQQAEGYLQVIDLADAWLPWSLKKLTGESFEPPMRLRQAIDAKQPAELDARWTQWQQIMAQPPFADKKG